MKSKKHGERCISHLLLHMLESNSPPVSIARAVLGTGRSCASVSSFSERFVHEQNYIEDRFGGGLGLLFRSVCLSALDSWIICILHPMLHHKI